MLSPCSILLLCFFCMLMVSASPSKVIRLAVQLYILQAKVYKCCSDLSHSAQGWISSNRLQLNPTKTQYLLIGTQQMPCWWPGIAHRWRDIHGWSFERYTSLAPCQVSNQFQDPPHWLGFLVWLCSIIQHTRAVCAGCSSVTSPVEARGGNLVPCHSA